MSLSKKTVIKSLLIVAVVFIAVLIAMIWQLDKVIEIGMRTVGSRMTDTRVEVADVSVSLFGGSFGLTGFKVANPEGFQAPNAIEVGKFLVQTKLTSLAGEKIVIPHLELADMKIDFEYRLSGSNISKIIDNINKFSGQPAAAPAEPSAAQPAAPGKKVVIGKLVIRNVRVAVSSKTLGGSMVIPLPPIEMNNIGEGKSLAETTSEILNRILLEITKVVDMKKLTQDLSDAGEATLNAIDKATDQVGGAAISAGASAGTAVQDATDRSMKLVHGIFGGK